MHNRQFRNAGIFCLAVSLVLLIGMIAYAEDVVLKAPVAKADTMIDKNGTEYVRMIINEDRNLGGVEYTAGVAVMAFGENVEQAKTVQEGDQLQAVAEKRDYNGRTSYTIRQFIE